MTDKIVFSTGLFLMKNTVPICSTTVTVKCLIYLMDFTHTDPRSPKAHFPVPGAKGNDHSVIRQYVIAETLIILEHSREG